MKLFIINRKWLLNRQTAYKKSVYIKGIYSYDRTRKYA